MRKRAEGKNRLQFGPFMRHPYLGSWLIQVELEFQGEKTDGISMVFTKVRRELRVSSCLALLNILS